MLNVLYVFGGEKASGAEKVIERLMSYNTGSVNAHLFISPGQFAQDLVNLNKTGQQITLLNQLKKLNRGNSGALSFYLKALKNYFAVSYRVYRYVAKNNVQVVHANTIVPASYLLPAILLMRMTKPEVKFVWSDHDLKYFSGIDHKLSGLCARFYDLTLVVSEAVKSKYTDSYHKKIAVLYNGLNTGVFSANEGLGEAFRAAHKIPPGADIIGLAGTIEPRKGQLGLLMVFKKLSVSYSNIYLLLAGPGSADHKEYTDDVLAEINANSRIIYLGKVGDMLSFYNGCDIIINNSSANGGEPLGTTIYEAMSVGKIVLASETGGTPEIITDGENGYIFAPDNEDELFTKLSYVLNNLNTLQQLTKKARERVEVKFNIVVMAEKYNTLLGDLTGSQN